MVYLLRKPVHAPWLRLVGVLAATALALALLPALALAQADEEVTPARVEGPDRFATAAAIATLTFDEATTAVVGTGQDYPDALAGSFAAGVVNGPMLLVARDFVPDATLGALAELGVERLVLLGGTEAIGAGVEERLADEGYETERVSGANRYETAAAVALRFGDGWPGGTIEGQRPVFLASGEVFADALSVGPVAARTRLPLLLTPRGATHPAVDEALDALRVERIIIIGGVGAVSGEVADTYRAAGYTVERLAGTTRTGTAATVADDAMARFGFSPDLVLLARGDDFPDALTASIHGAVRGAPVLLSATPDVLSPETAGWLASTCPDVEAVRALGGVGAVSASTLGDAVDAAEECRRADAVVAEYTTPLPFNPDRTHNIHTAADAIHGDVIPPGGRYSLDDAIGDRTAARGYRVVQNGCIGADGRLVDCMGGGISQLATTFVSAAWFSGIEIVDFRQHTIYFERYPMCHEATLARNVLDVVLFNNSPYDIMIETFYSDEFIGVRLLSRPWAEVDSWVSPPYDVDTGTGAFSVDCGRTITSPDGLTEDESYSWRYDSGYPGG